MAGIIEYRLKFSSNSDAVLEKIAKSTENISTKIGSMSVAFNKAMTLLNSDALKETLDNIKGGFDGFTTAGSKLDASLADLKAVTDITDDALLKISDSARKLTKDFGAEPAQNVALFKTLITKLSPEIANNIPLLQAMGKNVNVLSSAMGGDTAAAADVLSTALSQMGFDAKNPQKALADTTVMMNILTREAKKGADDLPKIGESLARAGILAKNAKLNFAQTTAAIQILDKETQNGGQAEPAFARVLNIMNKGNLMPQNILVGLQKAGVDVNKLSDTSLTLGERFKALSPIIGNTQLVAKLFGKNAIDGGTALLKQASSIDSMATSFQKNNDAVKYSTIILDSFENRLKTARAKIDDLKIGVFEATKSFSPWLVIAGEGVSTLTGSIVGLAEGFNTFADLKTNFPEAISGLGKMMTNIKSYISLTRLAALGSSALSIATSIGTTAVNLLSTGWATAGTWLRGAVGALRLQSLWVGLTTIATNLFSASWWAATAAVMAIPLAIAAVVGALAYVIYKTDGWGEAFSNLVGGITAGFWFLVTGAKIAIKLWLEPWLMAFDAIRLGWAKVKSLWDADGAAKDEAEIKAGTAKRRKALEDDKAMLSKYGNESLDKFSKVPKSLSWNKDRKVSDGISKLGQQLNITSPPEAQQKVMGQSIKPYTGLQKPSFKKNPSGLSLNETMTGNGSTINNPTDAPLSNNTGKQTANAIATGGTKSTNIHINFKDLVGQLTITSATGKFQESTNEMEARVKEALLRVLTMASLHSA